MYVLTTCISYEIAIVMYACIYIVVCVLIITVFQNNEHWDCTAKVHPELEILYTAYQANKGN